MKSMIQHVFFPVLSLFKRSLSPGPHSPTWAPTFATSPRRLISALYWSQIAGSSGFSVGVKAPAIGEFRSTWHQRPRGTLEKNVAGRDIQRDIQWKKYGKIWKIHYMFFFRWESKIISFFGRCSSKPCYRLGLAQAALFGSHQATELWTQDRPQMRRKWVDYNGL